MPRKRIRYRGIAGAFPADFPQRLRRFQRESGLPWAEIARRVGADIESVRPWREGRTRPNASTWRPWTAWPMPLAWAAYSGTERGAETKKGRHTQGSGTTEVPFASRGTSFFANVHP